MERLDRYKQRLDDFGRALLKLEQGVHQAMDDLGRDGVIQRFEFTYEQAWKTMKLWLAAKGIDARNPKDVLGAALDQGLIDDGNLWSDIHSNRNLMSHTYNVEEAQRVFLFIKETGCRALRVLHDTLLERLP